MPRQRRCRSARIGYRGVRSAAGRQRSGPVVRGGRAGPDEVWDRRRAWTCLAERSSLDLRPMSATAFERSSRAWSRWRVAGHVSPGTARRGRGVGRCGYADPDARKTLLESGLRPRGHLDADLRLRRPDGRPWPARRRRRPARPRPVRDSHRADVRAQGLGRRPSRDAPRLTSEDVGDPCGLDRRARVIAAIGFSGANGCGAVGCENSHLFGAFSA